MDFLTSPGAFVIEEDAVHCKEIVGLSEVHHNPVGIQFCCSYKKNFKALCISSLLVHSSDRHTYTSHIRKVKSTFQQWSAFEFDSYPYMCHIPYGKNNQLNKQQLNGKILLFCAAS